MRQRRSSADLFDVEQFPVATYRSRAVHWSGHNGKLAGNS
jgi:hypothetical protein